MRAYRNLSFVFLMALWIVVGANAIGAREWDCYQSGDGCYTDTHGIICSNDLSSGECINHHCKDTEDPFYGPGKNDLADTCSAYCGSIYSVSENESYCDVQEEWDSMPGSIFNMGYYVYCECLEWGKQ
jgi:hypothetical protein